MHHGLWIGSCSSSRLVLAQLLLEGQWDRVVVDADTPDAYDITRDEAAALLER